MVSLLVHAALGVVVIGWIVSSNPKVFTRPAGGSWFSLPECVYYVVGIASIALGGTSTFVLCSSTRTEPPTLSGVPAAGRSTSG